ncbi:MAG TPA: hypothetical protein VFA18_21470 [Gemmataceae bacterium]|jgi:hypothetical protein|nr:hypothetical protein [Gemmataceae bacterium]
MWIYRSLLAFVGGSCLVVLSATLTRTAASVAPLTAAVAPVPEPCAVPPAPAPRPDVAAERCLDQSIEMFRAERVRWLEMAIWQKGQLPGFVYEADGSYHLAPGQRFRLEMHTHPSEGESTMLSVSDGRELWRAERSGQGAWENVTRVNLSEVFALLNGPAGRQLREEFLQRPHFQGMTPLLRNLRSRLVWARGELLRQSSGERIHLVGVWSKEEALKHVAPNQSWLIALPRQCHLYLDAHSYWPERVEWWGPTTTGGPDRLLVQMEFRNPVFNRPLPPQTCNRLFSFHPGTVEIADETATITAELSKRATELTRPSTSR